MNDPFAIVVPDALGILASTAPLLRDPRHVTIDHEAIVRFVASFASQAPEPPPWDSTHHYAADEPDHVAGWVLALDALNFCFWSPSSTRWRVTWRDVPADGYYALTNALQRAVADGYALWDAETLRRLTPREVAFLLRPDPGAAPIPLLVLRHRHLVELGEGLEGESAGDLLRRAHGSGIAVITEVLRRFPSFRDVAIGPDGLPVQFFKRAQILVADLAGALEGTPLGWFDDLAALTAFADYKVPQVLRGHGMLHYDPVTAQRIAARELIPAGSLPELEIRAATIWACELIRQAFARKGTTLTAAAIDWLLWNAGQTLPAGTAPYHRTLTPFY